MTLQLIWDMNIYFTNLSRKYLIFYFCSSSNFDEEGLAIFSQNLKKLLKNLKNKINEQDNELSTLIYIYKI